jgi:ABC-type polysaccharide/polyol phosphate transport system ATPase subunit
LRHVSFQVQSGESVALIGTNGSGKSTALKLISRIILPTSGALTVRGRVAALLELGAGFHSDLSGRENIALNGSILGLSRTFIRRQIDEIIAFSELEQFIDVPVRNYSSGMAMRLGFSVATAFQPEILLIDEVLAVGDQAFQDRCLRRIGDIQAAGATVIVVSHDLGTVQKLCRRAIWLDDGVVRADGQTDIVASRYLEALWTAEQDRTQATQEKPASEPQEMSAQVDEVDATALASPQNHGGRWGSGEIRIEKVEILDAAEMPRDVFRSGEAITVRMSYRASQPIAKPAFGISFYDEQGYRLNGPNTIWGGMPIDAVQGRGVVDYIVDALPLLPGRYELTVAVYDHQITHPYDHWHRMTSFVVIPNDLERQDGVVYIPCRWSHRPEARA